HERVFIPVSHPTITLLTPKHLQKLSFTQSQYHLPFNQIQYK
ncbi:hypothetical protein, partial [Staphylococcus epidermidis]